MAKEVKISVSKGNASADLGQYRGTDVYKGISIDGISDIKPAHIKNHNKSDYLEFIEVKLKDLNNVKINLFQINTCNNGKTLELHIATGSRLKSVKKTNTYNSPKELLLHSTKPEKIQINFIIYKYGKGNEKDLYIHKCGNNNSNSKIPVYDELVRHQKGLNISFTSPSGDLQGTPDEKNGSILVGRQP